MKRTRSLSRLTLAILAILMASLSTSALGQLLKYTFLDLGTLGGKYSSAYDVNVYGQVVGSADLPDGRQHAFRTAPSKKIHPATDDLGTLGGMRSTAFGINDLGQVVGEAYLANGRTHAFRTAPNSPINPATDDLGTLGGAVDFSSAGSINNTGQVVGISTFSSLPSEHPFRTAPNSPINPATDDLGTLGGARGFASHINNAGQLVGNSLLPGNRVTHAYRLLPGGSVNPSSDLGGGSNQNVYAESINEAGQVVGYYEWVNPFGERHFYPYRTAPNSVFDKATDDMGFCPSGEAFCADFSGFATDVNNSGDVVGSYGGSFGSGRAFLYHNGVLFDLTLLAGASVDGWTLMNAFGINDLGQIVGTANKGEAFHAYLLTPAAPVPEPGLPALLMGLISTGGLLLRVRRR